MCKFSIYTCDKFKTDLISTICVLNFRLVIPVSFTVPIFQFPFPFQFISQQISFDFMRNILSCYFVRYDDFEFIKFPIHTRTGLLMYNVPPALSPLRKYNTKVCKYKTQIGKNGVFSKGSPSLAMAQNRCCRKFLFLRYF